MRMITICLTTLALLAGLLAAPAHAAESYDNCIGYIDTLPITISTQGVWCLRHDVSTAISSGTAISIATNNVTIDCNDFKIGGLQAGAGSFARGIGAINRLNSTVRNCTVRGFYYGIDLEAGGGHLVEDNRIDQSLSTGIRMLGGNNNHVQRNLVYDTGGSANGGGAYGMLVSANVLDNTVAGMMAGPNTEAIGIALYGLDGGRSIVVRGNQVSGLVVSGTGTATGISAGGEQQSVSDNLVVNVPLVNGTGIEGSNANRTFCRRNQVAGFSTAVLNCHANSNLDH